MRFYTLPVKENSLAFLFEKNIFNKEVLAVFLEIVKDVLKAVALLELENSWTVQRIKGAGNPTFQWRGCMVGFFFWWGESKGGWEPGSIVI